MPSFDLLPIIAPIGTESDIEKAYATLVEVRAGAVAIVGSPFFNSKRLQLAALCRRNAIPAISEVREFAEAGGLRSYGPRITDVYRQAGVYAGRILNGDKPADLPVVLPTQFEPVLNLKTAKALGRGTRMRSFSPTEFLHRLRDAETLNSFYIICHCSPSSIQLSVLMLCSLTTGPQSFIWSARNLRCTSGPPICIVICIASMRLLIADRGSRSRSRSERPADRGCGSRRSEPSRAACRR